MTSRSLRCALLSLALSLPAGAAAQQVEGFSVQSYDPTYAGDRFFAAPDATVEGHLRPSVKLTLSYANRPLRLLDSASGEEISDGVLVRNQLYLHLDAAFALSDRVSVGLGLPFAALQSGDGARLDQGAVQGGKLADMRVGARVALLGGPGDKLALGVQGDLWLPTGSEEHFAGDGGVRAHPRLIASGRLEERYLYSAALGTMIRGHRDVGIDEIGSALTWSAAGGVLLMDGVLQVGPELYGSTTFASGASPVEALLGAKMCVQSFVFGAGLGAALTRAPGAAALRGLASVAWEPGRACTPVDADEDGVPDARDGCPDLKGQGSPDGCPPDADRDGVCDERDACPAVAGPESTDGCPPDEDGDDVADTEDACPRVAGNGTDGCPLDTDGDGIPDSEDACPTLAGAQGEKPNGCPPPADRDGDGVPDSEDACPEVQGDEKTGCPADPDGDGIADVEDACPDQRGDDPVRRGCPRDRDADGVPDAEDACPDEAGGKVTDAAKNGCPAAVELRQDTIEIRQQIQFERDAATLKPESEPVLTAVAAILRERPEIRLAIEGHTDSRGPRELNLDLSNRRALAVRDWLIGHGGIDAGRLTASGLGPDKPVAPNGTAAGRGLNRRVEFHLVGK